jgi:zinc and cadmium transporter
MSNLLFALLATFLISLISLLGVFSLSIKHKLLHKIIIYLLALAAGTLMADAFFHLIPESAEALGIETSLLVTFLAFFAFFIIEKIFQWRHCHKENCHVHSFGYINLLGDSIHNFIDGLIIAASFAIDWRVGLSSSLAIALHELPQEFGDFGVLIHAGFSKKKAILLNFAVALVAILGTIVGSFYSGVESFNYYLLAIAAGGFIYIATSDLLPEIRAEKNVGKLLLSLLSFSIGAGLIYFLA